MFFPLSKVLWLFLQPSGLLGLLACVAAICAWRGRLRTARAASIAAALLYLVAGFSPLGSVLLLPLEERHGRGLAPDEGAPTGIIVLGGAIIPTDERGREATALNEAAERMTEAASLARRFPQARIVFSGGEAALFPTGVTEAAAARLFFAAQGLDASRFVFEDRSRNTHENALFTRDLVRPAAGERWLLITSAFHMPRAMGCFRAVGFAVAPWPVDYRTHGWKGVAGVFAPPSERLRLMDLAVKEWLGLLAYRLSGRTDRLFP